MKRALIVFQLLVSCFIMGQNPANATEGASSYYFPGASSTFTVAVAPEPGFMFVNQMLFYSGKVDRAVLHGDIHLSLRADAFYNYIGGFYTFEKPVLNGRLQVGAVVPVGYTDIKATIGPLGASGTKTAIGDTMISAALYWQKGNLHYKLVESVFAPTGDYSSGDFANIGRNYWGFDTSLAMTWMNMKTGTEISVTPGIMFNTKNTATDYKSGNEFHVDFVVNQFLKENIAVGLHGYYYRQITGDTGSGAKLGDFEGESYGFGPALLWIPEVGKGNLSVVAKWLHDVGQTDRLHGYYGQLAIACKF